MLLIAALITLIVFIIAVQEVAIINEYYDTEFTANQWMFNQGTLRSTILHDIRWE